MLPGRFEELQFSDEMGRYTVQGGAALFRNSTQRPQRIKALSSVDNRSSMSPSGQISKH